MHVRDINIGPDYSWTDELALVYRKDIPMEDSKASEDVFPPKKSGSVGSIEVRRQWKESGVLVKEEEDENPLVVQSFAHPHLAEVGFSASMTLNMENYESVKVEVHAKIPAYVEEMGAAFLGVKAFVDKRLSDEVKSLQAYRDEKRKKGR